MTWFWDRFWDHFGPPNWHPKSTQNHVKSMLGPILGQDGSNERFLTDFASNFDRFLIDFDMAFVWYSNDVEIDLRSIWDRLRDAFCNRIRHAFKLLPSNVHGAIIPVSSGSMKTTAARGTANGQPPFHSSLSYCGLDLSVSSKDVEIDFVHFGTDCDSILQPNTTCCLIAVFKCVKE